MKDKLKMGNFGGYFTIRHERGGEVLGEVTIVNTVSNNGIERTSGLINGTRTGAFDCLRIGTSETAAGATDTNLKAEIAAGSLVGAAATCTQVTTDTTNDSAYLVHTFTATGSYTIKEAGIFTTTTGGCMLARATFTGKAMSNGDTLTVYYKIDVD